jgi:cyclophilin family peptidyl-prolyl cis-trans isomerase
MKTALKSLLVPALLVTSQGLFLAASRRPSLQRIPDVALLSGSPLHIPLDGSDAKGKKLTFTATSDNELVSTFITKRNRSMRISVAGFGKIVFELFERRAPRVTRRIIKLADSGFYDNLTFHRVIDQFIIQGGDPTGTGTGGSSLGVFDDQFHPDLQHNRTGLLSMAKTAEDDTNDSQFFVTEGSTSARQLDFNHSIFGLLVEGERVREAISNVPVGSGDRPITDVIMRSVKIFKENQNAVLMLKAPEGTSGDANVTVTATNEGGAKTSQSFHVSVTPDTVNSDPFLADIPPVSTRVNTPVTFQLSAIDVEGDAAFFLDEANLDSNQLPVPARAHPDLDYSVDMDSGLVTVTPRNGLQGAHNITVATARFITAVDYQVVPITIER